MHQPSLALQQITESLAPPRHRSFTDEVFTEPQRLHKVLASCGFGSRRAMEEMILAGRITVNREPAEVGQKVGPGDEVRINGELVKVRFAEPRARILMYHKPAGEIVTRDDPEGRPTVFARLPNIGNGKWIAIGRLDFNTEGLLLFTNSGELANRMMHPRYEIEREYAVRILGTLTPEQGRQLLSGVELEDGPAKVEKLEEGGGEGSNRWYHVVIKEGRNREVRRLFEALGLAVSRLIRTRYGTVAMPSRVKRGQTLELAPDEVAAVLTAAGMKSTGSAPQKSGAQGKPPASGGRPRGASGASPGKGPRERGRGAGFGGGTGHRDGVRRDAPPAEAQAVGEEADTGGEHVIEPGNSALGDPTHHNAPVASIFRSKGQGKFHGRPPGQHGARNGQGQAHGGRRGQPNETRPAKGKRPGGPAGPRGSASPYVMTTLTVPGGVPEGLPGTSGPRPKGPQGQGRKRGPGGPPGVGGPKGPAAGPGKNRGRDNRKHRGPRVENPGNEAPPAAPTPPSDDDFNR
jgi:23S rRNA pseudouridine2605 synthase